MTETNGSGGSGAYPTKTQALQAATDRIEKEERSMTDEKISLVKLISKAEGATEPSCDLDAEIALLVGWTFTKMKGDKYPYWREPGVNKYYQRTDLLAFTKSIESALTLVPDGWRVFSMEQTSPGGFWDVGAISGNTPYTIHYGKHKFLPIAICIAALKARFV